MQTASAPTLITKNSPCVALKSVKTYLVNEKGIAADKVFTDGKGEANPVTGDTCKGNKKTKALVACLQPDRRVEVEIAGTKEVVQ